jgi:hypothetical protein
MNWQDRISVNPAVRSGKPCIKGTRITVYDVLEYLAGGMSEDQILGDFRISHAKTFGPPWPSRRHVSGVWRTPWREALFDENVSPKLVGGLASEFPGSAHVRNVGLRGAEDQRIWDRIAPSRLKHSAMFLGVDQKEIGQIGGGKRVGNGRIDIAMIQSLVRKDRVDDIVASLVNDRASPSIQEQYAALAADDRRNQIILDDVMQALEEKRSPIVLTERLSEQDRFAGPAPWRRQLRGTSPFRA